ncbi:MAG: hypothetical protein GWP04_01770 [Gammaproteobacteria bacterium]|nr:hypothetical protein [Gammaproteobacteria bacterium]
MFEAIEYIEEEAAGLPTGAIHERAIGLFFTEVEAVLTARAARSSHWGRREYAWWVVRREGEQLASWIADSRSGREFVVDISKGRVVDLV